MIIIIAPLLYNDFKYVWIGWVAFFSLRTNPMYLSRCRSLLHDGITVFYDNISIALLILI